MYKARRSLEEEGSEGARSSGVKKSGGQEGYRPEIVDETTETNFTLFKVS